MIRFDIKKAELSGVWGFSLIASLLVMCGFLCIFLLQNPYKQLHSEIFQIAEKTRNYYRDKPSYWNLSKESAINDGLLSTEILEKYKEYEVNIGQGSDGRISLPSDMSFDISAHHLNKSSCIGLLEMPLSDKQKLLLLKINIQNKDIAKEYSWGGENSLPVEKFSARDICSHNENTIIWTFQ